MFCRRVCPTPKYSPKFKLLTVKLKFLDSNFFFQEWIQRRCWGGVLLIQEFVIVHFIISIGKHTIFHVQFGTNLRERAFQKAPGWNISRYLPTTTCGLTKNSKNFQCLLRQVTHHIVSDTLEYCHVIAKFWSGHVMLLTRGIMPQIRPKPTRFSSFGRPSCPQKGKS